MVNITNTSTGKRLSPVKRTARRRASRKSRMTQIFTGMVLGMIANVKTADALSFSRMSTNSKVETTLAELTERADVAWAACVKEAIPAASKSLLNFKSKTIEECGKAREEFMKSIESQSLKAKLADADRMISDQLAQVKTLTETTNALRKLANVKSEKRRIELKNAINSRGGNLIKGAGEWVAETAGSLAGSFSGKALDALIAKISYQAFAIFALIGVVSAGKFVVTLAAVRSVISYIFSSGIWRSGTSAGKKALMAAANGMVKGTRSAGTFIANMTSKAMTIRRRNTPTRSPNRTPARSAMRPNNSNYNRRMFM